MKTRQFIFGIVATAFNETVQIEFEIEIESVLFTSFVEKIKIFLSEFTLNSQLKGFDFIRNVVL